jgi:hypothetical protein
MGLAAGDDGVEDQAAGSEELHGAGRSSSSGGARR